MAFLNKDKTIARHGYNRWLVPISALCIHLCIGQIYAFSVFNQPLSRLIGINQQAADDWKLSSIGWIFSIALFCLGAAAAIFGKWMERVGPRKAMFVAAICFSSGFLISALGVATHHMALLYIGSGLVGGIGLGLGYISPVSTLIKWFPDKPGMATGMAIMGFGGGAMLASPLSVWLMKTFANAHSLGVAPAFVVMGLLYLLIMMLGAALVRIPPEGWQPQNCQANAAKKQKMVTTRNVLADEALKTPQFYLLFAVLLLNVTAGIGVLGQASVMIREMFSGQAKNAISESEAALFVGFLSLFNMLGRFLWSSFSDVIGRKNTYTTFFVLGIALYALVPALGKMQNPTWFVAAFALIISMYGGGFATIPAYLKDLFGTRQVGAIHGRILLAWSLAAIIGPVLINYMREYQLYTLGKAPSDVYSTTMYIMAALLLIGLMCNILVKAVDKRHFVEES
ncbi:MFS transporter [bacterium]|nr:MFS transporter [bacterium]